MSRTVGPFSLSTRCHRSICIAVASQSRESSSKAVFSSIELADFANSAQRTACFRHSLGSPGMRMPPFIGGSATTTGLWKQPVIPYNPHKFQPSGRFKLFAAWPRNRASATRLADCSSKPRATHRPNKPATVSPQRKLAPDRGTTIDARRARSQFVNGGFRLTNTGRRRQRTPSVRISTKPDTYSNLKPDTPPI